MRTLRRVTGGWLGALALAGSAACATTPSGAGVGAPPPGDWVRATAPFPVRDAEGAPYAHPFLGGFDVPRPQFLDIDDDGDLDLFVQERSNELIFLENVGSAAEPRLVWRTDKYAGLDVGEWARFVDLDGDGDLDLLAEEPFSLIRFYRNVGTPAEARFTLAADTLRDPEGRPIFADRQNLPSVADVDCDGLPDLFLGRVSGTITRYELAEPGEGVPRFRFVEDRWQGIEIIGQIAPTPVAGSDGPTMHGANAMAFVDVDGDGDLDLLWGDFFEPGVLLIENVGSCEAPDFRGEPRPLRAGGEPVLTSGYNVPVPADIDGDGDLDLFLGVLGGAFNPNRTAAGNFWFLERTGEGELEVRTQRFLDGIDVGSESIPALGDLDGDGDLDLLLGNKLDPAALQASRLYRFENVGEPGRPVFALADTLPLGTAYHYAPALGDLDGNGELDLVVGTWNEGVRVFWNPGAAGRFAPTGEGEPLVTLTRGSHTAPALGDVDGDGDLDLIVGEASGELNFYRNEGTPTQPRFVLVSDRFLGVDAGRRSHPALADLDGDSLPDLVVGREEAGALFFRNVSRGGEVAFVPAELALPLLPYGAPAFGDVDGDGDLDVIAGTRSGGVVFFENRGG